MKRFFAILLCVFALLSMSACTAQKPEVEYYVSKRQIEHSTGDVNLTVNEYDDDWRILSAKTYLNGELSSTVEYFHNEDSSLVTSKTSSALYGESFSEYRQEFDEDGKLLKAEFYDNGFFAGSSEYIYDNQGREWKVLNRDAEGEVYSGLSNEYDSRGNLSSFVVEAIAYRSIETYVYDSKDRLIKTEMLNNDKLLNRAEYSWEGNTCHGSVYDADGKLLLNRVSQYDDAGNLLMEEQYDILGTLTMRTCYEYIGTDGTVSSGIK